MTGHPRPKLRSSEPTVIPVWMSSSVHYIARCFSIASAGRRPRNNRDYTGRAGNNCSDRTHCLPELEIRGEVVWMGCDAGIMRVSNPEYVIGVGGDVRSRKLCKPCTAEVRKASAPTVRRSSAKELALVRDAPVV
ncbi:hypothetical protein IEO21_09398 [Rhodonia placenta]|uniref:Uncharacterized protein n=1 Tax=Rhodonia placenta TaxID=104341 RepID=A0A8H7TYH7_9APHY|nr:hypothetical protein IEO21_09398 [Postia placenta]